MNTIEIIYDVNINTHRVRLGLLDSLIELDVNEELLNIDYNSSLFDIWFENFIQNHIVNQIKLTSTLFNNSLSNEEDICIICLENFKLNDHVCHLKCKHLYHYSCINTWIETNYNNKTCPTCRHNLS